ncbi:MAG: hypothetical protein HQK67_12240, partial [Desulfamplus sp.]|nr:hypothetical protein [Desulfamplus sp.]
NRNSSEGEICYKALFNFDSPCKNCPATEVIKTGKPSLKPIVIDDHISGKSNFCSCLYAYPMPAKLDYSSVTSDYNPVKSNDDSVNDNSVNDNSVNDNSVMIIL